MSTMVEFLRTLPKWVVLAAVMLAAAWITWIVSDNRAVELGPVKIGAKVDDKPSDCSGYDRLSGMATPAPGVTWKTEWNFAEKTVWGAKLGDSVTGTLVAACSGDHFFLETVQNNAHVCVCHGTISPKGRAIGKCRCSHADSTADFALVQIDGQVGKVPASKPAPK